MVGQALSFLCYFCLSYFPSLRHFVENNLVYFDVMCADPVVEEAGRKAHVNHCSVIRHLILSIEHHVSIIVKTSLLVDDCREKDSIYKAEVVQRSILVACKS